MNWAGRREPRALQRAKRGWEYFREPRHEAQFLRELTLPEGLLVGRPAEHLLAVQQ